MNEQALRDAIVERRARVVIIGCGYVGLPLCVAFAKAGFPVTAIEIDPRRVEQIRQGVSYIRDVESRDIDEHVKSGRLSATTEYDAVADAEVIVVAVPTPYDRAKQPDLSAIVAAAEGIAARLRSGQLVILESTTYPGTTDEVMRPTLERSGLRSGRDFWLAFSPERIDPGSQTYRIENTPKVVGGIDEASTRLATVLLEQIVTVAKVHPVSSARVAEMTKLLENTFRAVNIAFVNEIAMLCDRMGIDVWEVIDAARTKPYGFMAFYPGPGVGGHCIPVDPYYLASKAREYDFHTKFIELAAETNLAMPLFTVDRIQKQLNRAGKPLRGAAVLVIGAAFKKDVDDARNSAAIRVMEILLSEGANVAFHDPFVKRIVLSPALYGREEGAIDLTSVPLDVDRVRSSDLVAILVSHSAVDYQLILENAKLVFDAINATSGRHASRGVERL